MAFLMVFQYTVTGLSIYSWAEDGTELEVQEQQEEKAEVNPEEKPVEDKAPETKAQPAEEKPAPEEEKPVPEEKQEEKQEEAPAAEPEVKEEAPEDEPEETAEKKDEKKEDEKEEPEEEKFPEQFFVKNVSGTTVRISAPKGALPEESSVKVTAVKAGAIQSAVDKAAGKKVDVVKAFDITFSDKDGKEIEPEKQVSVNFEYSGFSKLEHPQVYHIEDSGVAEKLADSKVGTYGDQVSISAQRFLHLCSRRIRRRQENARQVCI